MSLEIGDAKQKAAAAMPALIENLKRLAAIRSCAFPGFPPEPVLEMAGATVQLLQDIGARNARLIEIPGGYPAVYAEVAAVREDAPTVLLYAHYDVQPAPPDQVWSTDPWTPTEVDGRIFGRGVADDKSGIIVHAGALQMFDGDLPVNIKILIEGEEETGSSNLADYVTANPDIAQCDAFIIADSGNPAPGKPALTTGLRGLVAAKVTVTTFENPLHSGVFGGAIPDALVVLTRLLATLHDDAGDVAIEGLASFDWPGEVDETQLRIDAGLLDTSQLIGTGSAASRLWSRPSVNIIGMDVPPIVGTPNALIPSASAKVSLRIAPGADPAREMAALTRHLTERVEWGAQLIVEPIESGAPFLISDDDPVASIALDAMSDAWDTPAVTMGSGGSIPLVSVLKACCPHAGALIMGAEDLLHANIHSANESVDCSEIEKAIIAEALFMQRLGQR
jgi:acetylornithine deacetylase/succinyl-diaminopimelate desuccinylase-like protein